MTLNDLNLFKKWFSDYCNSFYLSSEEDQENISLKVQHTYNVCENIVQIADSLSSGDNHLILAEVIALFHDVGRFPQYAKYKTFTDSNSVNHGFLGAKTLVEEKVLQNLPKNEQELVIQSVKFHNAFKVPDLKIQNAAFFLRLLRDADKLDIWRIFVEYYESPEEGRASAAAHRLPDIPEYSKDILSGLYKRQMVSISNMKTLNDFKLTQLSWVYDLNFRASFRLLLERDYINRFAAKLPQTDEIKKASLLLQEYVHKKLEKNLND